MLTSEKNLLKLHDEDRDAKMARNDKRRPRSSRFIN
ncbi:hypothetical protein Tsp_09302 [Trichinella spiralis]|nr:hypothetical protein Tsp_09302 [Trichinella spiralis]